MSLKYDKREINLNYMNYMYLKPMGYLHQCQAFPIKVWLFQHCFVEWQYAMLFYLKLIYKCCKIKRFWNIIKMQFFQHDLKNNDFKLSKTI